jgi:hypothetical protein
MVYVAAAAVNICCAGAAGFFLLQDALLHLPPVRRALVAACTRSGEYLSEKEARRVFQQASSRLIGEVFNLIAVRLIVYSTDSQADTRTDINIICCCVLSFVRKFRPTDITNK